MTQQNTKQTYLTLTQFAKAHRFITVNSIRWLMRKDEVFINTCVRMLGRKILIDESKALKYIDNKKYTKDVIKSKNQFGRDKLKSNKNNLTTKLNEVKNNFNRNAEKNNFTINKNNVNTISKERYKQK